MGGIKNIKEFDAGEVGMWLTCIGLGDKAAHFVDEGVDGDLLIDLTKEDLKNDLGLSSLQAKKLLKGLEFTQDLANSEGAGSSVSSKEMEEVKDRNKYLEGKVHRRDDEIKYLMGKIEKLTRAEEHSKAAPAPAPVPVEPEPEPAPTPAPRPPPAPAPVKAQPAPAPAPAPAPSKGHQRRGAPVVGGAARGAAGGAVKGAIFGAIVPGMDAGDGAAAGAAVGAFSGGMGGLAARRRRRR